MATQPHLVDPIEIIKKNSSGITNPHNLGIPEYENLTIYASLIVRRRTNTSVVNVDIKGKVDVENDSETLAVNFLGFEEKTNQKTNQYTTRYTNAIGDPNYNTLEGFGMTKIDIKINTGYVVRVNISFKDVKGISYLNRNKNSPFHVIHSFPPPMFELTFKGYYGISSTYQLHKIRDSVKFNSSDGSYDMDVEFVASTFSPLSDILMAHIYTAPYMNGGDVKLSSDSKLDITQPPNSVFELYQRTKSLYATINELATKSKEFIEFNGLKEKLDHIIDLKKIIYEVPLNRDQNADDIFINSNMEYIIEYISAQLQGKNIISSIKGSSDPSARFKSTNERFVLGCYINNVDNLPTNAFTVQINKLKDSLVDVDIVEVNKIQIYNQITLKHLLNDYIPQLKGLVGNLVKEELYPKILTVIEGNIVNGVADRFIVGIDLSGVLRALLFEEEKLIKKSKDLSFNIRDQINNIIQLTLGFVPTIGNVFKILCNDIEKFFKLMKGVKVGAKDYYDGIYDKLKFGNNNFPEAKKTIPKPLIYPWTTYTKAHQYGSITSNERKFPGDKDSPIKGSPEVIFTIDFLKTYIKKNQDIKNSETTFTAIDDKTGKNYYHPLFLTDSNIINISEKEHDYESIKFKTSENIYAMAIKRCVILQQYTYRNYFNNKFEDVENEEIVHDFKVAEQMEIVNIHAKLDAYNVAYKFQNEKLQLQQIQNDLKSITSFDNLKKIKPTILDNENIIINDDSININGKLVYIDRDDKFNGCTLLNESDSNLNSVFTDIAKGNEESVKDTIGLDFFGNIKTFVNRIGKNDKTDGNDVKITTQNIIYYKDGDYKDIDSDSIFLNDGITIDRVFFKVFPNYLKSLYIVNTKTDNNIPEEQAFIFLSRNLEQFVPNENGIKLIKPSPYIRTPYHDNVASRFLIPGIIQIPYFALLYYSGLIYFLYDENGERKNSYTVDDSFDGADLIDHLNSLSVIDKNIFIKI
jgi:hypothetical protein